MIKRTRARLNKRNADGLTLVHLAAKNHQIEQLKTFKKLKANFKQRTTDGETPLLLTCKHMPTSKVYTLEEIKIIDLLTQKSYDINILDKKGYSPLHYAARKCSGRIVEKLIRLGANVNSQTNNLQLTPLHCAMQSLRLDVVDALIRHGAKVNPVAIEGITPLHLAVASSSLQIVKYLIDHGAKINYLESLYFFSPMHVALLKRRKDMFYLLANNGANVNVASRNGVTALHLASIIGDIEITERLIQSGADVNCREKKQSITPLHIALSKGEALKIHLEESSLLYNFLRSPYSNTNTNYSAVFFSLLNNGADVKSVSKDGKNAFHFALEAKTMETDIIEVLLDSEIDVNVKECDTQLTPLLLASREGLDEVVGKLVKVGADVNAVTKDGKSSLHFAIETRNDWLWVVKLLLKYGSDVDCKEQKFHLTPLHVAAGCKGRKDAIIELINAGANVKALTKDGRSTLHLAAESGDPDNVKILIEHGVDVNHRELIFQYTALHLAVIKTQTNVIEELIYAGADVNAKDASGKTALHLATCYQDKMMEMLVKYGTYVGTQDNEGRTPLHYAIEHNNAIGLAVLIQSGVNINDTLLCRPFDVERIFKKRSVRQFLVNHLMELKALGFPIANVYEQHITQDDLQSVHYKNCINEVIMLKTHLLNNRVSLYDFLHMDPDRRFTYAKNMSCDFDSKFRIFKNYILRSYRETVDRKLVLEPAKLAFKCLIDVDLPANCVKRIFSYLKSWHLKAIIVAAQNEKNSGELFKTKICSMQ